MQLIAPGNEVNTLAAQAQTMAPRRPQRAVNHAPGGTKRIEDARRDGRG